MSTRNLPFKIDDVRKRRGEHSVSARERCIKAAPPPSRTRSDKRLTAWRSVVCVERVKERHTHNLKVVSFCFAHLIFKNTRKLSDLTYHSTRIICYSGGRTAVFFGSVNIFLSAVIWSLLMGNLPVLLWFFVVVVVCFFGL